MANLSDFLKMVQTCVDPRLGIHFPEISVKRNLYGNVRQYNLFSHTHFEDYSNLL